MQNEELNLPYIKSIDSKFQIHNHVISRNLILVWLLFFNQIIITKTGFSTGTYFLFAVYCLFCIFDRSTDINTFFLCLIFPNKYLQMVGTLIFAVKIAFFHPQFIKKALLSKFSFYFLFFSIFSAIINRIVWGGSIGTAAFQITFYCVLFFLMYDFTNEYFSIDWNLLHQIFAMEVLAGLMELVVLRKMDDYITGTLVSAHWYGAFLLAYGYAYVKLNHEKSVLRKIWEIIVAAVMIYICDAKHVWVCFFVAAGINFILQKLKVKRKVLVGSLTVVVTLVALVTFFNSATNISNGLFQTYILNPLYNKKFIFLKNTLEEMKSINGLIGFGLGQFGSQICLTMAKEVIYPWKYFGTIYTVAALPFQKAIAGLMTENYVTQGINISSMVLGYPLVSIVPLIAENGIIGLILLLCALEHILGRYKNATLPIMLILLCIFDTYLEIPCITMMLFVINSAINKAEDGYGIKLHN